MSKYLHVPPTYQDNTTPFESAEEAWFWFILAQQARNEGARIRSGAGLVKRACEPIDILKILDRLYRNRILQRDHLLVLRHYGRRQIAPDPSYAKEARAHDLWMDAMDRIGEVLISKKLMERTVLPFHIPTNNSYVAQAKNLGVFH